MNLAQVDYLISQLQKMASVAQKKREARKWARLSTHVTELKRWRDGGMKGTCLVDYKSLGIKLPRGGAARRAGKIKISDVSLDNNSQRPGKILAKAEAITVEDKMLELTLGENLSHAEELLGRDEFSSAISLAEIILKDQKTPDDVRQRAQQVVTEAKIKREDQIIDLLEQAQKAKNDKVWDAAEKNYRQALVLDKDDQRVLDGLNALLISKTEAEQKAHLEEIKINLQPFNQIDVLANAVREAEQLIARKKADDELVQLYQAGKDRWDELREKQGQTTTKARVGNLESRAEAVHEYEQYIIHNQMTVWDATLNTFIPTDEALLEARGDWEGFSRQETFKRLSEVDRNLPHNLDWARQRLMDAVNQQFYDINDTNKKNPLGYSFWEHDRAEMQARLVEIERLIKNRDQAEALCGRARTASPEDGLKLLMEARNLWEHMEGIDQRIEEQRGLVAYFLANQAETKVGEAQVVTEAEQFDMARSLISEAKLLAQRLPDKLLPAFDSTKQKISAALKGLEIRQKLANEFKAYETELNRILDKPELYEVGLELINKIEKRNEFKEYPKFIILKSVVTYYYTEEIIKRAIRAIHQGRFDEAMKLLLESLGTETNVALVELKTPLEILTAAKLQEAQNFVDQMDLLRANSILENISTIHKKFSLAIGSSISLKDYSKEVDACISAERDLYHSRSYLEEGKSSEQVDGILKRILNLKYSNPSAVKIRREAALLLAGQYADSQGFDPIEERLRFLAMADPSQTRTISLLESYRKQKKSGKDTEKELQDLKSRARIWFWGSILTAVFLITLSILIILSAFAVTIYMIVYTKNNYVPYAILSSLSILSTLVPILATKVVYDQSVRADNLANQIHKERLQEEKELLDKIREI